MRTMKTTLALFFLFCSLCTFAQVTVPLPKAMLKDAQGRTVSTASISDFDNPVIVVVYSVITCTSCSGTMGQMSATQKNTTQPFVKLVGISIDSKYSSSLATRAVKAFPAFDIYFDENSEIKNIPFNWEYPLIFFLDNNQRVVHSMNVAVDSVSKLIALARHIKNREVTAAAPSFDKNWWPVPASKAEYYRKTEQKRDGSFLIRDYYKNGTLQMEGSASLLHPTVREGAYVYYNEKGVKTAEDNFVHNIQQGKSTGWHDNGKVRYAAHYTNGSRHGSFTSYYSNGKTYFSGQFENDERTGKWTVYHTNGKKAVEATYINGQLQGRSTAWYETGKLKHEVEFVNNRVDYSKNAKLLHANGTPMFTQITLGNGYRHTYQNDSGAVVMTVEKNGNMYEISLYNGSQLTERIPMMNDKTIYGKLISWHKDGTKAAETSIYNNRVQGKAMCWWPNGQVREKVDFDTNTFEYFNDKGEKISEPKEKYYQIKKSDLLSASTYTRDIHYLDFVAKEWLQ